MMKFRFDNPLIGIFTVSLGVSLSAWAFTSCATGVNIHQKKLSRAEINQTESLNPYWDFQSGADIYFTLKKGQDDEDAAEFIDYFLKKNPAIKKIGKREKEILQKSDIVDVALYKKRYALKLSGKNFPASSASFYFAFSPSWKRVRVPGYGAYWQSKKNALAVAITGKTVFLSNNGLFNGLFNEESPLPTSNFAGWRQEAFASGWIHKPKIFDTLLENAGLFVQIPAEDFYILIYKDGGNYNCVFRLEMKNVSTAKAVASMLLIARNNLNEKALLAIKNRKLIELFFTNPPAIDGKSIVLNLPSLTKEGFFTIIDSLSGGPTSGGSS